MKACGPTVGGRFLLSNLRSPKTFLIIRIYLATITAHHLYLTSDEAACDPFAFCKPIPKRPADRDALVKAVASGDPKFFL